MTACSGSRRPAAAGDLAIRRRVVAALAVAQAALALIGCSPHYRTFTSYAPPPTDAGRQCVLQCLDMRQACRGDGDRQVEQCRLDAQRQALADNVLRQAAYRTERHERSDRTERYEPSDRTERHGQSDRTDAAPPPPSAVQPDYGRCDRRSGELVGQCTADFDLCYQNCGGEVTYTTQCVANCD